jgi:hypothetical protein
MKIKGLQEKIRALAPVSPDANAGRMTEVSSELLDYVSGAFVNGYFSSFSEGGRFDKLIVETK